MKKIISLFSAVAMIASLMTSIAFADENNKIYWTENSKTEAQVVLDLNVDSNLSANTWLITIDTADAESKGAVITSATSSKVDIANYDSANKRITFNGTKAMAYVLSGVVGTVTIDTSNVKESFKLPLASNASVGTRSNRAMLDNFTKSVDTENAVVVSAPEPDKFEAKVNNDSGEITFENAALSEKNKEISGKAIKLFGKTFTVKADSTSKFVITYDGKETKTFGKTAAEYLGIEGKGDATGNVTVGVIYDKAANYEADKFEISAE